MPRSTTATRPVTRRKAPVTKAVTRPATQPETRDAADVPATAVAAIDDPQTDVERASAAITLVTNRLTEAQADLAELRRSLAEVAFLAEVDPSQKGTLLTLRDKLHAAEARVGELTAAEAVGRAMAAEAQRRALLARKDGDWAAAADLLAEASITGAAIDSLAAQLGGLYKDLRQHLERAAAKVSPHLARAEYNISLPDLKQPLLLVLGNSGGPPIDPRTTLAMEPAEVARVSIASVVERHGAMVLRHRPTTEEGSDRG
jgi:hypothetical protein